MAVRVLRRSTGEVIPLTGRYDVWWSHPEIRSIPNTDLIYQRWRRGKWVEIPTEWVGRVPQCPGKLSERGHRRNKPAIQRRKKRRKRQR